MKPRDNFVHLRQSWLSNCYGKNKNVSTHFDTTRCYELYCFCKTVSLVKKEIWLFNPSPILLLPQLFQKFVTAMTGQFLYVTIWKLKPGSQFSFRKRTLLIPGHF